jgi:CubicO group peptidase (beta-lactamase class C family)
MRSNVMTPVLREEGKAALIACMAQAVNRGDVPGLVVSVVAREAVLHQSAAGQQDVGRGVPMRLDSIFRIASMTKPITSVALMMLAERGAVSLDDPVSTYLPEFDRRPVIASFDTASGRYETRPAKGPIRLRHLLANTSGLGYAWSDPVLNKLVEVTRKSEPELPLLHDPGSRWTYSPATRVLGWVVEKVTGEPIDAYLRSKIFEPLGMRDTGHAVPAVEVARVVTVHSRSGDELIETANEPQQAAPVRGDGGLYSTAHDYAQFVRMLLNGGSLQGARILDPETVETMGQNHCGDVCVQTQPAAMPARTRPFPLGAGRDHFGLGFQIAAADPRYAGFRSPGSLSWAGINNTHFWIDPQRGIGAIVLMQVLPFYDERCIALLRGIEQIVYQHLA